MFAARLPAPLPPGPQVGDTEAIHRQRLVLAMAEAAAEKGYAATTIADVVGRAKVSRRTFYEHFADKEACFLAAYDAAADLLIEHIGEAIAPAGDWQAQLSAGVAAYLEGIALEPAVARVFILEVLGAGPRALAQRRAVLNRFAEQLRLRIAAAAAESPEFSVPTPQMAIAIIGAINELVLAAIEDGRTHEVPALQDAAEQLVRAAAAGPSS